MNFWKSKTIYRKIILILTAVHLLGCFVFPLAKLRSGSSYLNQMMNWLGLDELPEHLSLFGLIRLLNELGGSDGIFFTLTIVANVIILGILLIGKKRASYVVTLIIWAIFSIFEYPAMASADSTRVYKPVFWGGLQIAISIAISIVAILGIILEIRAQQKMAVKAAMASDPNVLVKSTAGGVNIKMDPEKMEKMKEQAGNLAETSAAVAKKVAKVAVQGVYKATDAVKGFVEEAKNESAVQSQQKNVQMQNAAQQFVSQEVQPQTLAQVQQQATVQPLATPEVEEEYDDMKTVVLSQSAPKVKEEVPEPKQIPQTGTITGIRGMFTGAQIPLASGEELIIGRAVDICHIILEGVEISRKHCVVMYNNTTGNYIVTDSSGNGTFTGDGGRLPVNRATSLTPGTIICIGGDANAFKLGE